RMDLDAFARAHGAAEHAVDRDPLDLDVGVDLGRVPEDELAPGGNHAFEPAVDAEGLLEGELPLQPAALVEESVERRAFASGLHATSGGLLRIPDARRRSRP